MTEKKLYTCDICHTDYANKTDAQKCEKRTGQKMRQCSVSADSCGIGQSQSTRVMCGRAYTKHDD